MDMIKLDTPSFFLHYPKLIIITTFFSIMILSQVLPQNFLFGAVLTILLLQLFGIEAGSITLLILGIYFLFNTL